MAAKFAVFGHPVAHSLSPRIHAAFGKQAGIALEYVAIDTPPEGFTAYFVELTFPGNPVPFKFTTPVRVLPDVLPFKFEPKRRE